jgi:hypothetical protein
VIVMKERFFDLASVDDSIRGTRPVAAGACLPATASIQGFQER